MIYHPTIGNYQNIIVILSTNNFDRAHESILATLHLWFLCKYTKTTLYLDT